MAGVIVREHVWLIAMMMMTPMPMTMMATMATMTTNWKNFSILCNTYFVNALNLVRICNDFPKLLPHARNSRWTSNFFFVEYFISLPNTHTRFSRGKLAFNDARLFLSQHAPCRYWTFYLWLGFSLCFHRIIFYAKREKKFSLWRCCCFGESRNDAIYEMGRDNVRTYAGCYDWMRHRAEYVCLLSGCACGVCTRSHTECYLWDCMFALAVDFSTYSLSIWNRSFLVAREGTGSGNGQSKQRTLISGAWNLAWILYFYLV